MVTLKIYKQQCLKKLRSEHLVAFLIVRGKLEQAPLAASWNKTKRTKTPSVNLCVSLRNHSRTKDNTMASS